MRVAVVGHDASDAALAKRIGQMRAEGHAIRALTFRRGEDAPRGWDNIDLGPTFDADFRQRLAAIARGARIAARAGTVREAEVCWARNLDAGLVAAAAGAGGASGPPLVYECLDVHDLLSGEGTRGALARTLEARVVRRAARIVISAPDFETHHFAPRYGRTGLDVIENRIVASGPRPPGREDTRRPLTIGWFGVLRCQRSLDLLLGTVEAARGALTLRLAGRPARTALPRFDMQVAASDHAVFLGAYAPGDLANLYADTDVAWAGDWSQAGANSRWLLPNRLYEAGWHGAPVLASAGTATARWIETHGTGIVCAEEPAPDDLAGLLAPDVVSEARRRLARAPNAVFAAEPGEVSRVLAAC